MPLLPPLISPEELRYALGDERVRVFDATVFLRRAVNGGPYTVESGRESYTRAHIPGAGFADIPGALSDPASLFAFTLPAAEHFAAAAGRLGIGDGTHVVAYAQDAPMWATRLWWLLRYFGHDDTSVLDGRRPRDHRERVRLSRQRPVPGGVPRRWPRCLQPPRSHPGQRQRAVERPGRHGDEPLPPAGRACRRPSQRRYPGGPAGHRLLRRRHLRDGRPVRALADRPRRRPAVRRFADRVERQPGPAPHHRLRREITTLGRGTPDRGQDGLPWPLSRSCGRWGRSAPRPRGCWRR